MKASELTIEVNAKLNVSKDTAEACLKLVEIYCNENGVKISVDRDMDGTDHFNFFYPEIISNSSNSMDFFSETIKTIGR